MPCTWPQLRSCSWGLSVLDQAQSVIWSALPRDLKCVWAVCAARSTPDAGARGACSMCGRCRCVHVRMHMRRVCGERRWLMASVSADGCDLRYANVCAGDRGLVACRSLCSLVTATCHTQRPSFVLFQIHSNTHRIYSRLATKVGRNAERGEQQQRVARHSFFSF